MELPLTVAKVVTLMKKKFSLRELKALPVQGEFAFDAVLGGEDPQTLIVVKAQERITPTALQATARTMESFVWSLYTENKRNLVSLVLLLHDSGEPEQLDEFRTQLQGVCRLFIVDSNMGDKQLVNQLSLVVDPELGLPDPKNSKKLDMLLFETLSDVLKNIGGSEALRKLAQSADSAEELRARIDAEFQRRLEEVHVAIRRANSK
jgi:hypothetical protein